MKLYSNLIFFCLLIAPTFLYFFSITTNNPPLSSSSSCFICLLRRRSMTQTRSSSSNRKFANQKINGLYEETKQFTTPVEGLVAVKYASSGENLEEQLVYHIDYHGVTTHPAPTPKHPKP